MPVSGCAAGGTTARAPPDAGDRTALVRDGRGAMKQGFLFRHIVAGTIAGLLTYVFWLTRPQWSAEMRFWRAVGDAGLMLLLLALLIGPAARHWSALAGLIPWRRELGIWFGIMALGHTGLILAGWARWDLRRFLGYEFVPQLDRYARLEPGFGLANLLGLVAVFWTLVLMATSSNRAIAALGGQAWKWLQYGAYIVFYLVVLHTAYFLFMHYTPSFHRATPEDRNWFRLPFLLLSLAVPALQISAFARTVARHKHAARAASATPVARSKRQSRRQQSRA
jgi:methionine sulfoxide reductase heme-binding subunit